MSTYEIVFWGGIAMMTLPLLGLALGLATLLRRRNR